MEKVHKQTDKQTEILLQTINRYWNQAIQQENQRANFTNYILLIVAGTQGYIVEREFDRFSTLLSIIIIVVSLFGMLITAKYYERFRDQTSKVGRLMEKLIEVEPEINLDQLEDVASKKHKNDNPILSKIRLNKLWLIFYGFFLLLGIFDLLIIMFHWYSNVSKTN